MSIVCSRRKNIVPDPVGLFHTVRERHHTHVVLGDEEQNACLGGRIADVF